VVHDRAMARTSESVQALSIRRVWIAQGCIACGWCGDLLPGVFARSGQGLSQIAAAARKDCTTDANAESRSPLRAKLAGDEADFLAFVAAGCPPAVIQFD